MSLMQSTSCSPCSAASVSNVTSSINSLSASSPTPSYLPAIFINCPIFSYFSSAADSFPHSSLRRNDLYWIFLVIFSISSPGVCLLHSTRILSIKVPNSIKLFLAAFPTSIAGLAISQSASCKLILCAMAYCSTPSILVFPIFLVGTLIILLSETESFGLIIYLIYATISLISFLSKNLNAPRIL